MKDIKQSRFQPALPKTHGNEITKRLHPLNMSMFYDGLSSDSSPNMNNNLDKLKDLFIATKIEECFNYKPLKITNKRSC